MRVKKILICMFLISICSVSSWGADLTRGLTLSPKERTQMEKMTGAQKHVIRLMIMRGYSKGLEDAVKGIEKTQQTGKAPTLEDHQQRSLETADEIMGMLWK